MTMYKTPYRRRYMPSLQNNDRIARNISFSRSDVHIPLDVKDEKDAFILEAIVPGLSAEDIDIEILNDTISISCEFKQDDDKEESYLRREHTKGNFYRSLRFGSKLEAGKADANLENGILSLRVPKVPEAQPKTIKVKTK